jgi:hypothetical protein
VLFDPLAPPAAIERLAEEGETAIVLTCPWHRRDAEALANRWARPCTCRRRTRATRDRSTQPSSERATGCRSASRRSRGMEPNDLVLRVENHRALVAGDTLQDRGDGLQFLGELANNVPAERGVAAEQILEGMRPLLALPVETVPLTHGAPADRAALERALAASPT